MLIIHHVGQKTSIPDWPETNTIEGLFQALARWALCPRMNYVGDRYLVQDEFRKPFRGRAWGHCVRERNPDHPEVIMYIGTKPIYPDSPNAVSYCGNFMGYSFGFHLVTDEPALIERLDAAISANMLRPEYQQAALAIQRKR
jgi:hypothetical protein